MSRESCVTAKAGARGLRNVMVNKIARPEINMWNISEKVSFCNQLLLFGDCWQKNRKQTYCSAETRGGLYSVGCHNSNKFIEKIWTLLHGTRVVYNINNLSRQLNVLHGKNKYSFSFKQSLSLIKNYNVFLACLSSCSEIHFSKYTGWMCWKRTPEKNKIYICEWCARKWFCKNIFTQKLRNLV